MSNISMKILVEAVAYYEDLGYKLIDVPQCVDLDISKLTKPEGVKDLHHSVDKVYVASAEQSFLQLHKEGLLPEGKYITVTPCYREESELDETHYKVFLKAEIIVVGKEDSYNVMRDALRFMNKYLSVDYTPTREGRDTLDIIHNWTNTELGSYGTRKALDGTVYTYGTALAEPRFSYCIKRNTRQHLLDILEVRNNETE